MAIGGPVALGQVRVDRFYPPSVAIGSESTIKAEGKFEKWPVEVVSQCEDIQIRPLETSGELRVVVADGAAPGVAWIRLHDKQSASKLIPLLIEPLSSIEESEPNAGIGEANAVEIPAIVSGRLEKRGDLDCYAVNVESGERLVVDLIANRWLASPMDGVLQLCGSEGNVLVQSDDVRGLDPQIVFEADADTTLYVRVFAFPETPNSTIGYAGGSEYVYSLRMTTGPYLDHALPLISSAEQADVTPVGWNLPSDKSPKASKLALGNRVTFIDGALGWQVHATPSAEVTYLSEFDENGEHEPMVVNSFPVVFSGRIQQPGEVDRLRFQAAKGKRYRARVLSRVGSFPLDSVLRLVDLENGSELARNDDQSRDRYDAELIYTATADRQLELQISDLVDAAGLHHAYSVVLGPANPSVELTVDDDQFTLEAGKQLEIPVAVERQNGFDSVLRLEAKSLPEGLVAEPVVSQPKGDSSKEVKLVIKARKDVAFRGPLELLATSLASDGQPTSATFAVTHRLNPLVSVEQLWLTVTSP